MKKISQAFVLTVLLAMMVFGAKGQTSQDANTPEVKPLEGQEKAGYERLTFQNHESHYFRDQTKGFLLDIRSMTDDLGEQDSLKLVVNKSEFYLQSKEPHVITGLQPGEVSIKVKKAGNEANEELNEAIHFRYHKNAPLFTNDAIVLGILVGLLALIFGTANSNLPFFRKFYTYVPPLLLCYFLPSLLNSFGLFNGEISNLYYVASRYLLPASLVLLTLSIDLQGIKKLGGKSVIMFLTGTVGIVIGGPLAVIIVSLFAPDVLATGDGPDAVWRGLSTVAGSWIGGGANQTAMFEVFGASSRLFSAMIAVDVIVANVWMAFLLYGAGISKRVDRLFNADASAIDDVRQRIENYNLSIARIPQFQDLIYLVAVGLGMTAIGHLGGDLLAPWIKANAPYLEKFSLTSKFFWIIVIVTTSGLLLSFTRARRLEGVGASKMGSVFLYILVATIGMKMNILAIFSNPGLFMIGGIWMLVHITLLLSVGKLIKAPFFFTAVGSQANVGGAASAPIVASAFHPSLAPVGVLLAVLGYAIGTYAAWFCGVLLQFVSP